MREATVEELEGVRGIGHAKAKAIHDALHAKGVKDAKSGAEPEAAAAPRASDAKASVM